MDTKLFVSTVKRSLDASENAYLEAITRGKFPPHPGLEEARDLLCAISALYGTGFESKTPPSLFLKPFFARGEVPAPPVDLPLAEVLLEAFVELYPTLRNVILAYTNYDQRNFLSGRGA